MRTFLLICIYLSMIKCTIIAEVTTLPSSKPISLTLKGDYKECVNDLVELLTDGSTLIKDIKTEDWSTIFNESLLLAEKLNDTTECFQAILGDKTEKLVQLILKIFSMKPDQKTCFLLHLKNAGDDMKQVLNDMVTSNNDQIAPDVQKVVDEIIAAFDSC